MKKNRETIRVRPNNFFLFFSVTILLAFLTAGCGGTDQPEVEEVEPTATTAVISFTPTPDLVSPTPTTPLPTAAPETPVEPVVRGSQVITTDNVDQIEFLDRIGRGTAVEAYYLEGGDRYVIVSKAGFDTYSSDGELRSHIPVIDANYELSQNGRYLAMRAEEVYDVVVWDLYSGEKIHTLTHEQVIPPWKPNDVFIVWIWNQTFSLKFGHNNDVLAIGYGDYSVGIWDFQDGTETILFEGIIGAATKTAFSPDDNFLIAMDPTAEAPAYIWDIVNQEVYASISSVGTFGDNPFSSDNSRVVMYYNSGYSVYSLPLGEHLFKSFTGEYQALVGYSPDGEYLVAPEYGIVLNAETGEKMEDVSYDPPVYRVPISLGEFDLDSMGYLKYQGIIDIGFSEDASDGGWGISEQGYFIEHHWTEEIVKLYPVGEPVLGNVTMVKTAPIVYYCNQDSELVHWEYFQNAKRTLDECVSPGLVTVSRKGDVLAYTDTSTTVKVISEDNEYRVGDGTAPIVGLFMDSDGEYIVVAYDAPISTGPTTGKLFMYILDDEGPKKINLPITGEVVDVTFSLDGTMIAASDPVIEGGEPMYESYSPVHGRRTIYPGQTRLWNTQGGAIYLWDQQSQGVAFNLDGSLLALGDPRGNIVLISTSSGEVLVELKGIHGLGIIEIMFSADGATLFALSEDGSISKWGVSSDE